MIQLNHIEEIFLAKVINYVVLFENVINLLCGHYFKIRN